MHLDLGGAEPPEQQQGQRDGHQVGQPGPHAGVAHVHLGREQAGRQQREQPVVPGQIQALPERRSARLTVAHGRLGTGCRRTRAVGHGVRVVSPPVSSVEVLLSRIDPGVPLPSYAHPGDAGADLVTTTDVVIPPGERAVVGTGIAVALPLGYAG